MKKKLEEKIIDKVFRFETKKTAIKMAVELIGFIFLSFAIFITGMAISEILTEQQSFDLFHLFEEDGEIVKEYFWDSLVTFYHETPKLLLMLILVFLACSVALIIYVIRNFHKFVNRFRSLVDYWRKS